MSSTHKHRWPRQNCPPLITIAGLVKTILRSYKDCWPRQNCPLAPNITGLVKTVLHSKILLSSRPSKLPSIPKTLLVSSSNTLLDLVRTAPALHSKKRFWSCQYCPRQNSSILTHYWPRQKLPPTPKRHWPLSVLSTAKLPFRFNTLLSGLVKNCPPLQNVTGLVKKKGRHSKSKLHPSFFTCCSARSTTLQLQKLSDNQCSPQKSSHPSPQPPHSAAITHLQ